jgi:hypothetical protein
MPLTRSKDGKPTNGCALGSRRGTGGGDVASLSCRISAISSALVRLALSDFFLHTNNRPRIAAARQCGISLLVSWSRKSGVAFNRN